MKILRHPGTPESIGRGVAIGCFTAFFIPFSVQLPIAFYAAVRLKAARLAALSLTWISNPLTVPFIYPLQCFVGAKILQIPLGLAAINQQFIELLEAPSLKLLGQLGSQLLLSFFVGGFLFGSVAAAIGYIATLRYVRWHRTYREQRWKRRGNHKTTRHRHYKSECSIHPTP